LAKSKEPETSTSTDADMGYDPSLIKVPENIKPRYSGTDHVEHGRPHPDHGDQEYDPRSLDALSDLDPADFKRTDNVIEGPQSAQNEDPVEP